MQYSIQRSAFMSNTYQLTIELPAVVKNLLPDPEQETKRLIATKLYLDKSVSIGKAAEIAGIDKVAFETWLSSRQIPISLLTLEDVMTDAEKIRKLRTAK
jgi:predicted HTH domain antitoxin